MSSGNNGAKKSEELHPHPVMEQVKNVQYCVNSPPPWGEALLLGFQHYILSLGNIVLFPSIIVPQMGGGNDEKAKIVQTLLFTSGVNTLLQSLFGTRLPLVMGGSYAYLIPMISIIQANKFSVLQDPELRFMHTMRSIQGALIVTSSFQILLGFLGLWRNVVRLLSPLSVAPLVTFTGLGLYHLGFPLIAECIEVGIPHLIFMYLPTYLKLKRPICDRFAMLFSIAIVWFYAAILTWSGAYKNENEANCRTDSSGLIAGSPWIDLPYLFLWGVPTFKFGDAFTMMIASFVASVESTGVFHASARYGSATPVPPSVISRGVGWLGIGTMLNAVFGGVTGCAATAENAGLLAMTRVGSRRVVQISAGFMIFFSILASAGLGFLQFCNLNSFRTNFILGFSLFLGFSLPQYFREHHMYSVSGPLHTNSRWFNDTMSVIFMSHATIAAAVAVFLDRTLPFSNDEARKDSGLHWWDKFVVYSKDVRSDEFYKLPCQLNSTVNYRKTSLKIIRMVDVVVSYAVEKLGNFLIQEVSLRQSLRENVLWLRNELSFMQAFLKDAEKKQEQDNLVQQWVFEITSVANETVSILEAYSLDAAKDGDHAKEDKLHNIGKNIQSLKKRVMDMSRKRDTYGITHINNNAEEGSSNRANDLSSTSIRTLRREVSYADEDQLFVGFQEVFQRLLDELLKKESRRNVISIYGMGGLGKTTLARNLYNSPSLITTFQTRAWICVSQQYSTQNLLRSIIKSIEGCSQEMLKMLKEMSENDLETHLRNLLKECKYLVVVDDVWHREAWESLKRALPDNNTGSRVILTTRKEEVAERVIDKGFSHKLRFLNKEESWDLLCKKLHPENKMVGADLFSPSMEKLAKEMVEKCKGLPLAIVVLGGILSYRKGVDEWQKVKTHLWQHMKNDSVAISHILSLSYNDLSFELKQCFLYIGIFQEDHVINAEKLMYLWPAEGFIPRIREENWRILLKTSYMS
ncbi:hypothetical protein H5410_024238 [Solanum commersonii]|uniref:Uncharacterized protein n=1 Tax=Solanum commersonii TaxID=4109 RepID=A0A9J5ZLD5_SOLCO|nr:hypothetical protein H5410_024238 [Solanum commersonii]